MNMILIKYELLRIRRSFATKMLLAFALLAAFYSVWSGATWQTAYNTSLQQYEAQLNKDNLAWRQDLIGIEAGNIKATPYNARPMNIRMPAIKEAGPTAHLATGMLDILPARLMISPWRNEISMVEAYEFDNPMPILIGRLDFAFFVNVIVPLLMIALNFDVIASDRSRGTSKMLMANPITESGVILSRMITRTGLLFGIVVAALIYGLFFTAEASVAEAGPWLLLTISYLTFWFGLIFFFVSRSKKGVSGLSKLIGVWLLLTLVIPAASNSFTEFLYPQPSKLELLSDSRYAASEANKRTAELTDSFLTDHPDLTIGDEGVPGYFQSAFLANSAIQTETKPVVVAFADSTARREAMLDRLQYLSPTAIMLRALTATAQTDAQSHATFVKAASTHLELLREATQNAILSKNRISVAEYDQLPSFDDIRARTETAEPSVAGPVLFMLLLGIFLLSMQFIRPKKQE